MSDAGGGSAFVRPFGDRAIVVVEPDAERRETLVRVLATLLPDTRVRGGMAGLLVESTQPTTTLLGRVETALAESGGATAGSRRTAHEVTIPVVYDGADLTVVAEGFHRSTQELVRAHQDQTWSVAMMGFAPGFAYLLPVGDKVLPWDALPRRASPRSAVPAGSVALAAGMSAVYPEQMPGGWHLLGRTQVRVFDASAEDAPALLAAGDHVRFVRSTP